MVDADLNKNTDNHLKLGVREVFRKLLSSFTTIIEIALLSALQISNIIKHKITNQN